MTIHFTPTQALQSAQTEGFIRIAPGVYLNSRESIVAEQADYDDMDGAKTIDFTKAPFWLTTDEGHVEPIYGEEDEDLIDTLANA